MDHDKKDHQTFSYTLHHFVTFLFYVFEGEWKCSLQQIHQTCFAWTLKCTPKPVLKFRVSLYINSQIQFRNATLPIFKINTYKLENDTDG